MFARRLRSLLLVLTVAVMACSGSTAPPTYASIAGTYAATTLRVRPDVGSEQDLLEAGVRLTITITEDRLTSGMLSIPQQLTGGGPIDISMAGTATIEGELLDFIQNEDSFVRSLLWRISENSLTVTGQRAGANTYIVVLTRQN